MTIKPSLAAIAVMFMAALFLTPSVHAKQKPNNKQSKPTIVKVQLGDTLSAIAKEHGTTYVRLFNANKFITNPDVIDVGQKIRIPKDGKKLPDRFSALMPSQPVAATTVPATSPTTAPATAPPSQPVATPASSAGNTYYRGYCTWYVKERRPDLPNRLGNGGQWAASAAAQGYATGSTPRAGAVAETTGHVAYVESVNGNGTITISEMNGPAGFGVVGSRTVPASQYHYIY
jgi:surface antigen|tara:strand:- start:2955 stop:3647 length:693 start_codon:yes stop_codon:yes gene_type:complete